MIALATLVLVARELGWGRQGFGEAQEVSLSFPLCSAPGYSANCVVDGDTIRIGERRIRLTGFDAPELDGKCPARVKRHAKRRLSSCDGWRLARFSLTAGTTLRAINMAVNFVPHADWRHPGIRDCYPIT